MREDMAKVIVERPRVGGRPPRKGRAVALEDLPQQEGMRRRHRGFPGRKQLNETLNPLARYLDKQVGRPWDKVYAEICRRLKPTSTVQQHVRDHLADFVAGAPRQSRPCFTPSPPELFKGYWRQPLYVDARDGILKRTRDLPEVKARLRARPPAKKPKRERIRVGKWRELRRIAGVWYEVTLAPLPEPEYGPMMVREYSFGRQWAADGTRPEYIERPARRLLTPAVYDVAEERWVYAGPQRDEPWLWRKHRREHSNRRYAIAKRALKRGVLKRRFCAEGGR